MMSNDLLWLDRASKLPPWNLPRNGLILAMDGYRDTYGRNIMPAGSDNFLAGWLPQSGETINVTDYPTTININGVDTAVVAKRIQGLGNGTSFSKYYCTGATSNININYNYKVYAKVLSGNARFTYRSSLAVGTTLDSTFKPVTISVQGDGINYFAMQFTTNIATDVLDIVVYHPQINLGQLFDYSPPAGLPANPLDYYRNTNVQNGSTSGGDSNDIAGYTGVGWQMNTASNPDNYFKIAKGGNFDNLNYATCITIANALSAGGGNFGRIHDKASGSALTGHLSYLDANRKLTFSRYNGVSNYKQWVANDAPAWGTNNVLITRFEKALNDSSVELMVNGVNQTMAVSSGGTPAIVDDANFDLYLGNRLGNDRYFNGTWYQHFWYNRILTDAESVLATKNIKSVLNARGVVING